MGAMPPPRPQARPIALYAAAALLLAAAGLAAQWRGAVSPPPAAGAAAAAPAAGGGALPAWVSDPPARPAARATEYGYDPGPPACGPVRLLRLAAANPRLPALRHEGVLRSSKPRRPTDVAIVSQTSLNRLPSLEGMCAAWGGAISAAIYTPLFAASLVVGGGGANGSAVLTPLAEVLADVAAFHARVDAAAPCKLDLSVWSQQVGAPEDAERTYPINAMRNRALAAAGAELLLSLDVDFWPSRELSEAQESPAAYAALRAAAAAGPVVIPALETVDDGEAGTAAARAAVAGGKPAALRELRGLRRDGALRELRGLRRDGALRGFKSRDAPGTQAATDLARWAAAPEGAPPYCVEATSRYEPYILVAAAMMPWYDERWWGRGPDKISHIRSLAAMSGGRFHVHAGGFVVHAPHAKPDKGAPDFADHVRYTHALLADVSRRLRRGTYAPVSAVGCGAQRLGPRLAGRALPLEEAATCAAAPVAAPQRGTAAPPAPAAPAGSGALPAWVSTPPARADAYGYDPGAPACGPRELLKLAAAHPGLPALRHEGSLRSAKRRRPTDVAIVTQTSLNRLPSLEGMCAAWGGAISAAVYLPLFAGSLVVGGGGASARAGLAPLADVLADVAAFHARVDAAAPCKLDLSVWSQQVAGPEDAELAYPINAMRNRAVAAAAGAELLLSLDVDLLPSRELSEAQESPAAYAALRAAAAAGPVVIPALETVDDGEAGTAVARAAVAGGKPAALRELRPGGALRGFKSRGAPATQAATDLARWTAAPAGALPYCVGAEARYEPYILLSAASMPWFDERWVGRGTNKIQHLRVVAHMAGGRFRVHPGAFVVHAPHPEPVDKDAPNFEEHVGRMRALYGNVTEELQRGTYVPVAVAGCSPRRLGPHLAGRVLPVERRGPCSVGRTL